VVKVYAHWMPGAGRAVADLVDSIYGGGGDTFAGEQWGTEVDRKPAKSAEMKRTRTLAYSVSRLH
jgi:hypothetical protein